MKRLVINEARKFTNNFAITLRNMQRNNMELKDNDNATSCLAWL